MQEAIGRRVSSYDPKHSRVTTMFSEGAPIDGISFLTGVDVATLSKHYVHTSADAAKRALRAVG